MVEIGCNYPDFNPIVGGDNVARRSAWRAVQAGSAGFHFGIFNVFTMNWDKTGTTTRSNQGTMAYSNRISIRLADAVAY